MFNRYAKKDWERFNLKREAEELNRKYFNGELSLSFHFKYGRFYRQYGLVKGRRNRNTGETKVTSLEISNRYDLDRETFLGILGHELIHVKFMQSGEDRWERDQHGAHFRSEVKRLRGLGLDVPLSEDIGKQTMDAGKPLNKAVNVIIKDGTWILVCRSYGAQEDLDRFNGRMEYTSFSRKTPIKLEYFITTNPIVRSVPIARNLKTSKGRMYKLEPEWYSSLLPDKTGERVFEPSDYKRLGNMKIRKSDYEPTYTVTVTYTQWSEDKYRVEQEGQKDKQTFSSFPAAVDFAIASMPLVTEPNVGWSKPYETQVVDDSLVLFDSSSSKMFITTALIERSDGEFLSEEELSHFDSAVYDAARESGVKTDIVPIKPRDEMTKELVKRFQEIEYPTVKFQQVDSNKIAVNVGTAVEGYLLNDGTGWFWDPKDSSLRNDKLENERYSELDLFKNWVTIFLEDTMSVGSKNPLLTKGKSMRYRKRQANLEEIRTTADQIAADLNDFDFRGVSHLSGPQPVRAYFDGPQYGTYRVDFAWDDGRDPIPLLKRIFSQFPGKVTTRGDYAVFLQGPTVSVWAEDALSHEKNAPWSTSRLPDHGSWHISVMDNDRARRLFPGVFAATAKTRKRTARGDLEQFKSMLKGVSVVDGEGYLDPDSETVNVAIVHDGSGFNPAAAVVVDSYESAESCIQQAFETLEMWNFEHYREHYDELVEEHGEEAGSEMFTETYNGNAWDNLPTFEVAEAIASDTFASKRIDIDPEFGLKSKPLYKLPPTTGKTRIKQADYYYDLAEKILNHYNTEYKRGWAYFLEAMDDVVYGEAFNNRLPRGFDMIIGVDLKRNPGPELEQFIWNVKPRIIGRGDKHETTAILTGELRKLVKQFEEGRFASVRKRKAAPYLRHVLNDQDVARVKEDIHLYKSYGRDIAGIEVGKQFYYDGDIWQYYDADAESGAPEGILLVLFNPETNEIVQGVRLDEVEPVEHSYSASNRKARLNRYETKTIPPAKLKIPGVGVFARRRRS